MTIVAVVAARYVRGVFPGSGSAVVAGSASANDLCVIDSYCRLKREGAVAVFADIARLYVSGTPARCGHTVVAGNAVAGHAGMVESCRQPARSAVAIVALIIARNMRSRLSASLDTVVAIDAAASQR